MQQVDLVGSLGLVLLITALTVLGYRINHLFDCKFAPIARLPGIGEMLWSACCLIREKFLRLKWPD